MTKILVINSFGPMGSTLLAGLVEKLGFGNVPLRKIGLHKYLMGDLPLNSGHMQKRLKATMQEHSKPAFYGGVSVMDRDNQEASALVNYESVASRIEKYEKTEFTSICELYDTARKIYYDAVSYKEIQNNRDWHIMMTVDFHRFDTNVLYQKYLEAFDEVHMLHLHRDFRGWINSLSSQAMRHPSIKQRIKFFPHLRYADYALYEKAVASVPGLHVNFDDLFDKPTETLATEIAAFANVDLPDINWETEVYDLYGKSTPHDKAFKRFDDNISYLPPTTLDYLNRQSQDGDIQKFPTNTIAWLRYLSGMCQYRLKQG